MSTRRTTDTTEHLRELRAALKEAAARVAWLESYNRANGNALASRVPDAIADRERAQRRIDEFNQAEQRGAL